MSTSTALCSEGLIGNTPLVEVKGLDTGLCRLFLKLENMNPGGSIKDRAALFMVHDAKERGLLRPHGTIVEATAGNTGLGLAFVAGTSGHRLVLVVPDKMSREKITHLKALGAEVLLTRSDVGKGHPDYYQDKAEALAKGTPEAWYVNQFSNPANARAHELTTGPEIWEQTNTSVDAIVVGVGSGGTLGGLTKYFKSTAPHVNFVIADPEGSVIAPYLKTGRVGEAGSWLVEGIGEDFIPANADFSLVRAAYSIPDKESFLAARELLRTNGILAGSSSGTLLAAALRYCREQTRPQNVVSLVCDGGGKYLSKMFNDAWMADQGFLERQKYGDLRDLVSRPYSSGSTVTLSPEDSLQSAYRKMKLYDISQLPVLQEERVVGVLDESDLLLALRSAQESLARPVRDFMTTQIKTLKRTDSIDGVISLLLEGFVAIVEDEGGFHGVITKIDVADYLKRTN